MLKAIDGLNVLRIITIKCKPEALGIKQRNICPDIFRSKEKNGRVIINTAYEKIKKERKWLKMEKNPQFYKGVIEFPPCGAYCKSCVVYNEHCKGCIETNGKPFHLKGLEKNVCPVWQCAVNKKVEHCGLCEEFPCENFLEWYDPKRGIITVLRRAGLLALRKKICTEAWIKWLEEKDIKFGT